MALVELLQYLHQSGVGQNELMLKTHLLMTGGGNALEFSQGSL
jgi:hypothetical protein